MQVVLLGPPGAGKGTQAERIARFFRLAHISTGDILREEVRRRTILGLRAKRHLDGGSLVPDALTLGIVEKAIASQGSSGAGCVFDGFPRNLTQACGLDAILEKQGTSLDHVIYLAASSRVLVRRLAGRLICDRCRKVYGPLARSGTAGVCGACGGELSTRSDDDLETVRNRLLVYRRETAPLIRFYSRRRCFSSIDAEQGVEQVWAAIKVILRRKAPRPRSGRRTRMRTEGRSDRTRQRDS